MRKFAAKHSADIITLCRIPLSIVLLFLKPFSPGFTVTYFLCGISDIADGYVARKLNIRNRLGALLDSIADIVFFAVLFFIFAPSLTLPHWALIWIAFIAALRAASVCTALIRQRRLILLHTYLNKATGFVLFISPFLYFYTGKIFSCAFACTLASIASTEELLINIRFKNLSSNTRNFF